VSVLPIVVAVLIGIACGALRRGRLRAIARTRVCRPELLVVALGVSVLLDVSGAGPSGVFAIVGLLAGLAFAAVNVHLVGMAVIAIGITANLLPVALNGAMPVRADALVEAEMITADEIDRVTLSGARELETDDTLLAFFGDTFPVRVTGQVVSLGDLILMVGLADVVANLMLQRRRRRLPPSAVPSLGALGWHEDDDILDLSGSGNPPRRPREAFIDLRDRQVPAGPGAPA
jgi:hypothetical protein